MKIQGIIEAEGVKLHVDVDVPDDQVEVYVTNVHPNCVVVPQDRWRVEFLGLPREIVKMLHDRGVFFLSQLNHENEKGVLGFDKEVLDEINEALTKLQEIAIIFEGTDGYQDRTETAIKESEIILAKPAIESSLEFDIGIIGLGRPQEESLHKKGVKTLKDLVALGRSRLLMTDKMDQRGVDKIEVALRKAGVELSD